MRHATPSGLDRLEALLDELRAVPGLVEKKRGVFYRRSRAFLHFHEDLAGLHADVRLDSEFERFRVETPDERTALVDRIWSSIAEVGIDDVRAVASRLPRSYEVLVHDRVKFRVGRIVYLAFSRDERVMGFAFPKDERAALVDSEPEKFQLPRSSDLRYHWVEARLVALSRPEMEELVVDAWRMVVPKRVAAAHLGATAL